RWLARSPFFAHTMSACIGWWPTTEDGLQVLHEAGVEMGTAVGHWSMLGINLPFYDAALSQRLRSLATPLPSELALRPGHNDLLLERLLRHRLRTIDEIVARGLHLYNEGLTYHHSYPPRVERTVRRMHIFAQQTADFPSWLGGNHSWFPCWWGYVEGGVPADAHVRDANETLKAALQAAGFIELTPAERQWYEKNCLAADAESRQKALDLRRRHVTWQQKLYEFTFGKHNKIYNDALRDVKPDVVPVLFENAGHDSDKETSALFADMAAACYESYTDYGEWPMSPFWTVEWAKAHCPGQPVWVTTDWGGSIKSIFAIFARGASGGGPPLPEDLGQRELARRGTALRLLAHYGAIARCGVPDQRCGILAARGVKQRPYWNGHAIYYHLLRLGLPAAVLSEESVIAQGIPATLQAVFLCGQTEPLDPQVVAAIRAFQQRGGKFFLTEDCAIGVEGALRIPAKIKNLWDDDIGGFVQTAHAAMWREHENSVRQPLAAALAQVGLRPLAETDWQQALALTLDTSQIRYVVVIQDKKGAIFAEFEPTAGIPVRIAGSGWLVRDLVKQIALPARDQDGATEVMVDLVTEPATILACYRSAPAEVRLRANAGVKVGGELAFACQVVDKNGVDLGPVPVRLSIVDPTGQTRETIFRAAGDIVRLPIASRDLAGDWQIIGQELITGQAITAIVPIAAVPPLPAIAAGDDVHVVDERHLRLFFSHPREKWVIIEPGQEHLLPLAEKIVAGLRQANRKARLWQGKPEEYDTIPLRWDP
ncbi:MAG: hypothetical protein N3A66_05025, partial [Planctomycetota bacterium]|nr:hypothetical protein [Planctomycetota bacterium]